MSVGLLVTSTGLLLQLRMSRRRNSDDAEQEPTMTNTIETLKPNVRSMSQPDRLHAARNLIPLIEAEADESEKLTHLTDKAVHALLSAGLFHMLQPRELGGPQLSYVDAMEVTELISWADGSAGWYVHVLNVVAASLGAYLPDKGAQRIYGDQRLTIAAGQGVPRGQARRSDGGYLIRGPWSYGSCIYHAEYYHAGCIVMENGKPKLGPTGTPEAVVCHFDKADGELKGNWDTIGLRGSGSYDYNVKATELFIPDHMCYQFVGVPPQRGGNQYSIGIIGFTSWSHTGWALGVTRRALDEIAKLASGKFSVFGALGEGAFFKQSYSEAESKFLSVRAFVYQVWNDICETLDRNEPASTEQITLARMALRHVHDVGFEITNFAYRAGGGTALRPSVLQRTFRDMHAGTQHVLLSDQIYQECARVLLGMTGKNPRWTGFGIVDDGPKEPKP
jgi:indole-3-acetate monooxygenase